MIPANVTTFKPSPQKLAFLEWVNRGTGNAIVDAVAGSGKTTALVDAVKLMHGFVVMCAYNKKAADEIAIRLAADGVDTSKIKAATFHSLGFRAWMSANRGRKIRVDDKKMFAICDSLKVPEPFIPFVVQIVSLAKQRAVGVLTPMESQEAWYGIVDHFELEEMLTKDWDSIGTGLGLDAAIEEGIRYGKAALRASVAQDKDVVDFDDMIYAPLIHNAKVWPNDWVLVDEAQDTNPARRALAKKLLKPGGRLIAVGDPRQAIYGFTGADNDAMDIIAREFACKSLPLTVTFRCPKAVVAHAQQWVSHITADETAPEGVVRSLQESEFDALTAEDLGLKDAVLCRNTKPLVQLAYRLIRRKIPCHVEGRDIGRGLLALAGKWKVKTMTTLVPKLEDYLTRETERLNAKGQETKAEALADRVETLLVIIESLPAGAKMQDLRDAVTNLFGDTQPGTDAQNLTLSTVHKSKGREWKRVYLYGRNLYMPSKYARQDWQIMQEKNLCYVAVTRAKHELVEVVLAPKGA